MFIANLYRILWLELLILAGTILSSEYYIPSEVIVKNWNRRTPDNFKFTAKFPKIITHDKKFKNVE